MKKIFLLSLVFIFTNKLFSQQLDSLTRDSLRDVEIRLGDIGQLMINDTSEETRFRCAYHFVRAMNYVMHINNSFYHSFDSLKCVSVNYSPDNNFRIITWNVVTKDERFHYFGVIQINPEFIKKQRDTVGLRIYYPLIDRNEKIRNALDTTVGNEFWYGANYYKILLNTDKKKNYYTLLGWNGASKFSNKKIIDVLFFEKNKPYFGAPIFDIKKKKPLKRMVFEFSNKATMLLRYEPKRKILIYESLSAPRLQDNNHPETYLPDGSYDFMIFKNGVWEKQSNILKDFKFE